MFSYSPFFPFSKAESTATVANIELDALDLVSNFYVTCPKLTRKEEDEHKRILYYYPPEESPKRKAEVTGMAGACVGFTSELVRLENNKEAKRRNHRFILSAKTACVVLPIDEDFIIGATFNRELCDKTSFYPHRGTLLKLVENVYEMYKLFYGKFQLVFEEETVTRELELKLSIFFSSYLPTIKMSTVPLVDCLDGVSFMPLAQKLFLEIQCFIEQSSEECPEIQQIMFLYQSRLAHHSIEGVQLKTIFRFVTDHLIPFALSEELQPEVVPFTQNGRFVQTSFDFAPQTSRYPIIKLLNQKNGKLETFHLIIYRSLNATLCFAMPESTDPSPLLAKLRLFLQPRMSELGSKMGETLTEISRPLITGIAFHFIYHNYDSLSFRTSLNAVAQSGNVDTITFTKEINRAIYTAFDKFIERNEFSAHLDLKVEGDLWVGIKRCNQRLLVVFLPNSSNSTLEDMNTYFTSILQSHFDHILLD